MKFKVYCQIGFLEAFYKYLLNDSLSEISKIKLNKDKKNKFKECKYIVDLYNFIHWHCELILDTKDTKTLLKTGKYKSYFRNLLRSGASGGSKVKFGQSQFQKMENSDLVFQKVPPQSIFLLDKTKKQCKELEEKYGFYFISREKNDILEKASQLFEFDVITLHTKMAGINKGWNFLKRYQHSCNAMIIVDNYLLNKINLLDNNLIAILDNLLPKKLTNQAFHLAIFTTQSKDKNTNKLIPSNLETTFDLLQNKIATLKRVYEIEFSIFFVENKYITHNRHIYTNYFWINSDYGFNCFSKNKRLSTNGNPIKIFPIFCNTTYENSIAIFMKEHIELLKQEKNNLQMNTLQFKGSTKHRLLNN